MPRERFSPTEPSVEARNAGSWGQKRRLELIDFRLQWDGKLNRGDLTGHFGISVPQASADIARYAELAPSNLVYDRSERLYVAGPAFTPVFPSSSAEHYLKDLLALTTGVLVPEESYLGWSPPVAVAGSPGRSSSSEVLPTVLKAIRQQLTLRVRYQSMSRLEPGWRVLSPHAIAHDGFRWHVRAFCHKRSDFLDFVVARMLSVEAGTASMVAPDSDIAWSTMVRLVLVPNPKLSEGKRKVIELDYEMTKGHVEMHCRQAVLYYVMQRLGLNADSCVKPEAQQIALENLDEVRRFLPTSWS